MSVLDRGLPSKQRERERERGVINIPQHTTQKNPHTHPSSNPPPIPHPRTPPLPPSLIPFPQRTKNKEPVTSKNPASGRKAEVSMNGI